MSSSTVNRLSLVSLFTILAVLYSSTFITLFNGIWSTEENMHGPLVLLISLWLLYRNLPQLFELSRAPNFLLGVIIFLLGLTTYSAGYIFEIISFEVGSIILIIAGFILLNWGIKGLRLQWFPLFFMFFMIPLPSFIVDTLTLPMKIFVSFSVEHILYFFDYPIARSGVILQLGNYMLLVANACAGLHTLLTLEAMGLLYLNLIQRDSLFRNVTLALLIIPISLASNVIRVLILCLVTYYLGDEMGQSYLHNLAGMVLFMSALVLIIFADTVVQSIESKRNKK